jgi:hypothetical protein
MSEHLTQCVSSFIIISKNIALHSIPLNLANISYSGLSELNPFGNNKRNLDFDFEEFEQPFTKRRFPMNDFDCRTHRFARLKARYHPSFPFPCRESSEHLARVGTFKLSESRTIRPSRCVGIGNGRNGCYDGILNTSMAG